jgi:hypothetical protein
MDQFLLLAAEEAPSNRWTGMIFQFQSIASLVVPSPLLRSSMIIIYRENC